VSKIETRASRYGLETGTPKLQSVGPIAFGPDGILFVADNVGARVFALEIADDEPAAGPVGLEDLDTRLAAFLGCPREEVSIRDLAVHPATEAVYLSVLRGSGDAAVPLLVRLGAGGELQEVPLDGIAYAQTEIDDAPAADDERLDARVVADGESDGEVMEVRGITIRVAREPLRTNTVTDLAYVDGSLLVAGASNEEFVSTLRRIPFPFASSGETTSLEIFHVSHGKYETHSPIRSFVPYEAGASILATYTCTPVVHFSVGDLAPGHQAKGRTVAELGAMNTPIDMVSYRRDGDEYLLVSNTRHPLFKIACSDIDGQEPLTTPKEPVGVPREALPHEGVSRMAAVNGHVLMLQRDANGVHLRSYDTAEL
jgi:hypothetical protein